MTDPMTGTGAGPRSDDTWRELAEQMTAALVARGRLRQPAWRDVLAAFPRHLFVPGTAPSEAYATAVVTQTRAVSARRASDGTPYALPTSSLSAPGAVAVALDALDLTGDERVLEIGTGTGYVAGLLSRRLGDDRVYSVDLDPELVDTARARLAGLGIHPTLGAGDGYQGAPAGAPYDRILATCAINHVPPQWIRQLAPGGRIVAPAAGGDAHSPLLILDRTDDDEVTGRLQLGGGVFMPLRPALDSPLGHGEREAAAAGPVPHHGTTPLDPARVLDRSPALGLFCHLHLPGLELLPAGRGRAGELIARHRDCTAAVTRTAGPDGRWPVTQSGPYRVWDTVESACALFEYLGRPEPDRYGITALDRPHRQYVWLDDAEGPYAWPLDPTVTGPPI